jgi:hypothetical protein
MIHLKLFSEPAPFFTAFSPLDREWKDELERTKTIYVDIRPTDGRKLKTAFAVAIQVGSCRTGINWNSNLEGLKYHKRQETNMWNFQSYDAYYLKAKSVSDLTRHACHYINKWFGEDLDDFEINVVFRRTTVFFQLEQDEKLPEYHGENFAKGA